jgi:hypothetical protein
MRYKHDTNQKCNALRVKQWHKNDLQFEALNWRECERARQTGHAATVMLLLLFLEVHFADSLVQLTRKRVSAIAAINHGHSIGYLYSNLAAASRCVAEHAERDLFVVKRIVGQSAELDSIRLLSQPTTAHHR